MPSATDRDTSIRGKLLAELLERLERQEIIYHLLASYEIRPISAEYSPPVHYLQQLRKALVSKDEMKRVEGVEACAGATALVETDRSCRRRSGGFRAKRK